MFKRLMDRIFKRGTTNIVESEYLDYDSSGDLVRVQWVKSISNRTGAWFYYRREIDVTNSRWQNRGVSAWLDVVREKRKQLTAKRADYELLAFIEG